MTIKVDWNKEIDNLFELLVIKTNTLQQVGDLYGVTRERIRQVVRQYLPELAVTSYGKRKAVLDKLNLKIERQRRYYGRTVVHGMSEIERARSRILTTKKNNVRTKGEQWEVDMTNFLWPEYCPILGIKLNYFSTKAFDDSPSFDRKDNTKGYITGNVYIISQKANRIKSNASKEELLKIIDYMEVL